MSFLSGSILWNLLWIIPLILILTIAGGIRRAALLRRMFGTDERAARFSNASSGKRVFRIVLLSLVVLLLAVAAARPSWGKQVMQDTSTGRDLLMLFDVSRSMLSDDVKPSRMDHAKWLVREIVKKNPGDRFGLIAFAGESFLVCPLTVDRASFIQLVDDLDTDTIPVGGTNVQLALEEAVKAFEGAQGTHKAVILVTDGDELTGRGASVVGELAKAQIPVFAVGVGDPANPAIIRVKDDDGKLRVLTDHEGNPVKSPLNEPQLTELARRTGGIYVRSTAAYSGIDELETRIRMLDRKESENAVSTFRPIERPAYPLAAAIVLLAFFFCVSETRPRSVRMLLALAALMFFTAPAESRAQAPAQIQQAKAAAPANGETAADDVSAPEPVKSASELYNSGLEQQQVEHDDEKARTLYERAIAASEKEPLVRASSYQNIGVISHLDARSSMQGAAEKLQAQDLNSAEKTVDEALVKLNRAEELYRESMRSAVGDASVIRNQQILLADRKQAEEMKKQIEELKKLMEQARQQTQQAHDQQQQENQQDQQQQQEQQQSSQEQQQSSKDQQQQQSEGQNQQDQQQQQQDQQQQQSEGQNQQDQQSAQDMTRQAEDTVSELERKASEMNQEQQKQAAQQAREELQKAREEQQQGNGEKAEEHLQNALDTLNRDQQDQSGEQDRQDQQDQSGEQDKQDQQDQSGEQGEQDQQLDAQQGRPDTQEDMKDMGDIDKQQAEAILNMMSKDELDFKDANQMRRPARLNNRVEKDW